MEKRANYFQTLAVACTVCLSLLFGCKKDDPQPASNNSTSTSTGTNTTSGSSTSSGTNTGTSTSSGSNTGTSTTSGTSTSSGSNTGTSTTSGTSTSSGSNTGTSTTSGSSTTCSTDRNYFGNSGGTIGMSVTCSGSNTLTADDGSETIEAILGSQPSGTEDFNIVSESSTPGDHELVLKINYYGGSTSDNGIMQLQSSGKKASVCLGSNGKITIKWKNVTYKYGTTSVTTPTEGEMTCP